MAQVQVNFVPEHQHLGSNPRAGSAKKPLFDTLEEPFSDRLQPFQHHQQVARVQVNFVPKHQHLGSNPRAASAKKPLFDTLEEPFSDRFRPF